MLTRIVVPLGSHPPEPLAVLDHVAQIPVAQYAGVDPEQALVAVNRGQIQAGSVAEHDVDDGRVNVGGAVQTVGQGVGAATGDDTHGKAGFGQQDVRVIEVDALVAGRPDYQAVEELGEGAIAAYADSRLKEKEGISR